MLKALDTIGNCQSPVFSLGVSHHMHKINTCENLGSIGHRKLQDINEGKKHPFYTNLCAFRCLNKRSGRKYFNIWVRNYLFLKIYVTSEGAVSQNVFYYQQLSIACYQVRFYAYYYFEHLLKVSSVFKCLDFVLSVNQFCFNITHWARTCQVDINGTFFSYIIFIITIIVQRFDGCCIVVP